MKKFLIAMLILSVSVLGCASWRYSPLVYKTMKGKHVNKIISKYGTDYEMRPYMEDRKIMTYTQTETTEEMYEYVPMFVGKQDYGSFKYNPPARTVCLYNFYIDSHEICYEVTGSCRSY